MMSSLRASSTVAIAPINVVIVEDQSMVRDALVGLLARTGRFKVVGTAGTVSEGAAVIEARRPHVVLADLSLPDGNALDIVRATQRERHGARVLVMTGFRDYFYASEALDAGAAGYVLKHQPTAEVLTAIDTVARGEQYVSPSLAGSLRQDRQAAKPGDPLGRLTPREQEIFRLVVGGGTTDGIAKALGVSFKTIDTHRTNINRKLGLRTTAALLRFAAGHGIDIDAAGAGASSRQAPRTSSTPSE